MFSQARFGMLLERKLSWQGLRFHPCLDTEPQTLQPNNISSQLKTGVSGLLRLHLMSSNIDFQKKSSTNTLWSSTTSFDKLWSFPWQQKKLKTCESELLIMFRSRRSMLFAIHFRILNLTDSIILQVILSIWWWAACIMSTYCSCFASHRRWHPEEWPLLLQLVICDGALVWVAAAGHQVQGETICQPCLATTSSGTAQHNRGMLWPWWQPVTLAIWVRIGGLLWWMYVMCKPRYSCRDNQLILHLDPASLLRGPCLRNFVPDRPLRQCIIDYLAASQWVSRTVIQASIPSVMPRWSNVHIYDGDRIRCEISQKKLMNFRDSAFVWVSQQFLCASLNN